MKPLHTTMIFRSNTYTIKALFLRTTMFAFFSLSINAGYAGIVPKFLCLLAAYMLLREVCRLLISILSRLDETAALSVAIRGLVPSAPALRSSDLAKLIRKGSITLHGKHNSNLRASISSPYRLIGLKQARTVRVAFHPGDFGLEEFDRIMHELGHIPPVAAAIEAIQSKDQLPGNANSETNAPLGAPPVPQLHKWPPIASSLWHAMAEGFRGGLTSPRTSSKA